MRKIRVIACLLSAALLSAAAGCGNQNSQGNSSGANSGEAEVVTLRLAGQSPSPVRPMRRRRRSVSA